LHEDSGSQDITIWLRAELNIKMRKLQKLKKSRQSEVILSKEEREALHGKSHTDTI